MEIRLGHIPCTHAFKAALNMGTDLFSFFFGGGGRELDLYREGYL